MNPEKLYQLLGELLNKLGVSIRIENFDPRMFSTTSTRGGICRIGTRMFVLLDARAPIVERVWTLARAASSLSIHHVYVVPAVRQLIEKQRVNRFDSLISSEKLRLITNSYKQN